MKFKFLQVLILSITIIPFSFIAYETRMNSKELSPSSIIYQPEITPLAPQSTTTIVEPPTQEEYNLIRMMTGLVFLSVIIVLFALWANRSRISL